MSSLHQRKLGRKPRVFNPAVPHMSALLAAVKLPPPPPSVHWAAKMPSDLGMMLNDQLGCCTISSIYHTIQVWTYNIDGQAQTNPDSDVLATYERFCGYKPSDPSTDQGGVEQHVLHAWLLHGVPILGGATNKLLGWFEADPRNHDDVKRVINDCGSCYIGLMVPENIMDGPEPPQEWTVDPSAQIVGGHAVNLTGYETTGGELIFDLISWGGKYRMSSEFFDTFVDECYSLIDADWVAATGVTPLGMSMATLTQQMRALQADMPASVPKFRS